MRRESILKHSSDIKKHVIGILISLAVHALIIHYMTHYFISIKILQLGKKVTQVYIPPGVPLLYSSRPESSAEQPIRTTVIPQSDMRSGGPGGGGTIGRKGGSMPAGTAPAMTGGAGIEGTEARARGENPSASFLPLIGELLISKSSSTQSRPGYPVLILGPRSTGPSIIDPKKYDAPPNVDLRSYLYSGIGGGGIAGSAAVGVRGAGRRGRTSGTQILSPQARIYDITPWARLTAEHVQKSWAVSPLKDIGANLTVRILVIIDKSGALSSLNIMESSEVPLFDQAALHAVEQSVPFPRLPDDFPEQHLEILLVFESHD